jgi:ATP-dependent Clp protease ATP-binding subunit ClpA
MFERFSTGARQSVKVAQEEARALGHSYLGTEHLLLGMIAAPGPAAQVLNAHGLTAAGLRQRLVTKSGDHAALDSEALATLGIDLDRVREATEANLGPGVLDRKPRKTVKMGHLPLTKRAKKVLELSLREAVQLKSGEINTGHLLLGLLRERDGLGAELLRDCEQDADALRAETAKLIGDRAVA